MLGFLSWKACLLDWIFLCQGDGMPEPAPLTDRSTWEVCSYFRASKPSPQAFYLAAADQHPMRNVAKQGIPTGEPIAAPLPLCDEVPQLFSQAGTQLSVAAHAKHSIPFPPHSQHCDPGTQSWWERAELALPPACHQESCWGQGRALGTWVGLWRSLRAAQAD